MRLAALRLVTIALLAACEAGAAPVSAVDATGARIVLAAPAARIVSLAPNAT
jgi:ABC-type Fe3+-hydroxamate transport system substrate-binding protein